MGTMGVGVKMRCDGGKEDITNVKYPCETCFPYFYHFPKKLFSKYFDQPNIRKLKNIFWKIFSYQTHRKYHSGFCQCLYQIQLSTRLIACQERLADYQLSKGGEKWRDGCQINWPMLFTQSLLQNYRDIPHCSSQ